MLLLALQILETVQYVEFTPSNFHPTTPIGWYPVFATFSNVSSDETTLLASIVTVLAVGLTIGLAFVH